MGYTSCPSSNAAKTMFANWKEMEAAQIGFKRVEEKDLLSWNTVTTSYVQGHFS